MPHCGLSNTLVHISSNSFSFPHLSPSMSPAASSPSLSARPHVSQPCILAVPPSVADGARTSFLQLQPLFLLPEPLLAASAWHGIQSEPPGFIWPILSDTGKGKRKGETCRWAETCRWSVLWCWLATYLCLSIARIRACRSSHSTYVCIPPLRACGEREGWGRAGEVQGESAVPPAGRHQHLGGLYHPSCFQRNRGAQGLLYHTGKDQILSYPH